MTGSVASSLLPRKRLMFIPPLNTFAQRRSKCSCHLPPIRYLCDLEVAFLVLMNIFSALHISASEVKAFVNGMANEQLWADLE